VAIENQGAFEVWQRLRPDTEFAVQALSSALADPDESPAAVLEAYLFAKRALAQSMQSLLRSQLPAASCAAFHELRGRIQDELHSRFSDRVPQQYLKVPYGTKAHEELFALLHQKLGSPVDSARLRTVNGDDIHTERRIRELRELGLDIASTKVDGHQYYTLCSPEADAAKAREFVAKAIRKSKALSEAEKDAMAALLG
jgi:tRNA nucleotidyltransferase/poly(A) polymerase